MKGRENLAISKENPFRLVSENANLALHALTRHANDRSKMAMVYESISGNRQIFSFFEIEQFSNKIANLLQNLDSGRGDRIFTLLNRTPELYATIPAVLKLGAAIAVLFPDFGTEAIRQRLEDAGARILLTDSPNLEKVRPLCGVLPMLEHIVVIGEIKEETVEGVQFHDFNKLLEKASNHFETAFVSNDDICFLIYTSGTTGLPKGVVHRHAIRERLTETAKSVLQLEKNDFYWCTADPGWVTGLNYGIFAPWLLGMPILVYEGEFDAYKWLDILERNQVTCLYTTPTLLRLMRNEIGDISQKGDFALTRIFSAGEPLNTEVISWAERIFDAPIYDNYWQTETGSQIIANRPNVPVRRGSMGKAVEGVNVAIIDEKGKIVPSGVVGDIAIRPTLNSLFKGYWNFPEATRACFRAGWYITRDHGKLDENGYFWFVARNDDVITCEAQRIGPFEVENALLSHPAVAESAAIGVADVVTTEHVKAFIVLRKGFEPTEKLAKKIANHVLAQLSPLATPKEIEFVSDLPKTKSGKIQRDQLRRKGSFDKERVFIIDN